MKKNQGNLRLAVWLWMFVWLSVSAFVSAQHKNNEYVVKIELASKGRYVHNVNGCVGLINWGDGHITLLDTPVNNPTHYYETPGEYVVVTQGKIRQLDSNLASKAIVDVVHIGGSLGITNMDYAFRDQRNLTTLRKGIFDELKEVRSFYFTFGILDDKPEVSDGEVVPVYRKDNRGLAAIPEGLFDKCKKVLDFGCTFFGCKVTEIPQGLFDCNIQVRNFGATFCGTDLQKIPLGLFDCNQLADNFSYTFYDCRQLEGWSPFSFVWIGEREVDCVYLYERSQYPLYYKNPVLHQSCFENCYQLLDYDRIPTDWK